MTINGWVNMDSLIASPACATTALSGKKLPQVVPLGYFENILNSRFTERITEVKSQENTTLRS